jgi:hypothetical protein
MSYPSAGNLLYREEACGKYINLDPKGWLTTSHKSVDYPLFAKQPSYLDISQQQIGDCWFLAALVSILSLPTGPDLIECIMTEKDLPEGRRIIVRLFDKTLKEYYFGFEKSIVYNWITSHQYHASVSQEIGLWPAVLEKALTAFDKEGNFSPGGASYDRIAGGYADRAFQHILGVDAEREHITHPASFNEAAMQSDDLGALVRLMMLALSKDADKKLIEEIFTGRCVGQYGGTALGCYEEWAKSLSTYPHVIINFQKELEEKLETKVSVKSESFPWYSKQYPLTRIYRVEEFEAYMQKVRYLIPASLHTAVLMWVKNKKILPGKRGTTLYSTSQIALFDKIKKCTEDKKPVCISTPVVVGRAVDDYGSSGGEKMSKGLAGNHAYAVTGTLEDQGFRLLTVVNPWGTVGRGYTHLAHLPLTLTEKGAKQQAQGRKAFEVQEGLFCLDLHDLTKRFDKLHYCKIAP